MQPWTFQDQIKNIERQKKKIKETRWFELKKIEMKSAMSITTVPFIYFYHDIFLMADVYTVIYIE